MMPLLTDLPDTERRMVGMVVLGAVGVLGFVRLAWVRLRMLGAMGAMLVCMMSAAAEPPEKPIPKALPVADDEPVTRPIPNQAPNAFMPFTRQGTGANSKRGDNSSVEAAETPLSRYYKLVISQVERKWHLYLRLRPEGMNTGEIEIVFYVTKKGKVEGLKVINDKHSTPVFTEVTKRAIMDAEIPPIPADVIPLLPREDLKRLKLEFNVLLY